MDQEARPLKLWMLLPTWRVKEYVQILDGLLEVVAMSQQSESRDALTAALKEARVVVARPPPSVWLLLCGPSLSYYLGPPRFTMRYAVTPPLPLLVPPCSIPVSIYVVAD